MIIKGVASEDVGIVRILVIKALRATNSLKLKRLLEAVTEPGVLDPPALFMPLSFREPSLSVTG